MPDVATQQSAGLVVAFVAGATIWTGACVDSPPDPTAPFPLLTADAGHGRIVTPGTAVTLEARSSSTEENLTYGWSLMRPSGSVTELSSMNGESTELVPDILGSYDVELAVSDGERSAVDTVNVTALESHCDALMDLLPTPVSAAITPFQEVDDASVGVPFATGFQFHFYGTAYDLVWVNTNGGMTFGAGEPFWDLAGADVVFPAIAVFWGDMSALVAPRRPAQLYHEACPDRFILYYREYQDLNEETWTNTATVALLADGTIIVEYGEVGSEDILVGVMDGTHSSDQVLDVQDAYPDYDTSSGVILFDAHGSGARHLGELSGRTLTFTPAASPAAAPRPTR